VTQGVVARREGRERETDYRRLKDETTGGTEVGGESATKESMRFHRLEVKSS
jgi:hypothetical protein